MKTTIKQLSIVLAFALFISHIAVQAQTKTQSEIDAFINKKMKELHIPALSYAVMQNGEYISSGVYGLAEVELNAPANEHTLFNVGSVGKTFTAAATLLLEQDGKLSIKDPIGKHLDGIPDSWNDITIEHLLNHTSGIKDYCQDFPGYTLLPNVDRAVELTPEQYIEMCTSNPLNFPTGERFAYSNSNYALLGFIIRKHIDTSMDEFMRKRVFEPAGMMDTRYEDAFALRPNRAKGYHWDSTGVKNGALISNFYSTIGDCGILTTGKDLAKWGPALVQENVLSKEQLDKMWTPHRLNGDRYSTDEFKVYGLGWHISDQMGSPVLDHAGALMKGYTAFYWYYPEYDLSIAVMSNRWVGNQIFEFYTALAEKFLPKEINYSVFAPFDGSEAEQWIGRVMAYASALAQNTDLTTMVDPVLIEVLGDDAAALENAQYGQMMLASQWYFLQEKDMSQKQLYKYGEKVHRLALFSARAPFYDENTVVYFTMYLSEADKILSTHAKVSQKAKS